MIRGEGTEAEGRARGLWLGPRGWLAKEQPEQNVPLGLHDRQVIGSFTWEAAKGRCFICWGALWLSQELLWKSPIQAKWNGSPVISCFSFGWCWFEISSLDCHWFLANDDTFMIITLITKDGHISLVYLRLCVKPCGSCFLLISCNGDSKKITRHNFGWWLGNGEWTENPEFGIWCKYWLQRKMRTRFRLFLSSRFIIFVTPEIYVACSIYLRMSIIVWGRCYQFSPDQFSELFLVAFRTNDNHLGMAWRMAPRELWGAAGILIDWMSCVWDSPKSWITNRFWSQMASLHEARWIYTGSMRWEHQ